MTAVWTDHCIHEIQELHQFFEDWFHGRLAETDDAFARFADVLDTDFHIISPQATIMNRKGIIHAVRSSHGKCNASTEDGAAMKLWIENAHLLWHDANHALAIYEEWQRTGESDARGRLSTVLFVRAPDALNAVRWMHVHETWLSV